MATTKTPKPTLPTAAASTPAEDPETLAAVIPPDAVPPPNLAVDPSPETPADTSPPCDADGNTELRPPAKSVMGSTKGAAIEGQLIAVTEIRPAITDHRVQLVDHIYPDGTCDALPTMSPRLVIASRITASMMTVPRYITVLTGDDRERARDLRKIATAALDLADELMQIAGERHVFGFAEE